MTPPAERRPILLLANPASGGKPGAPPPLSDDADRLEPQALADELARRGLQVTLHVLAESDDLAQLTAQAVSDGRDVVVAGGDGTVGAAAATLVGTDATLGILALGSFNNVARGMGLPAELDGALDVIAGGSVGLVDVGTATHDDGEPELFFEAAAVGLEAAGFGVMELAERRGRLRALRLLWRVLRQRRRAMWLTVDGRRRRTRAPSVVVCNTPYHGAGFALVPDADPADGQLHVAVFDGMSTGQALLHYLRVARGREAREPGVRVVVGTEIRVEAVRGTLPAHADGRSIGITPVVFSLRPGALRIFR